MADYNYYDAVKDDLVDLINYEFKNRLSEYSDLDDFSEEDDPAI